MRRITEEDYRILCQAAEHLPLEPRARILPEERLQAAILLGDAGAVDALVRRERPGIAEERVAYLYGQARTRSRHLVNVLHELYSGRCQVCLWDPRQAYAEELCQGHHLEWLSRGGEDELDNMLLFCPNHHAAIHQCDAPFDFADHAFDFSDHREPLQLNLRLA